MFQQLISNVSWKEKEDKRIFYQRNCVELFHRGAWELFFFAKRIIEKYHLIQLDGELDVFCTLFGCWHIYFVWNLIGKRYCSFLCVYFSFSIFFFIFFIHLYYAFIWRGIVIRSYWLVDVDAARHFFKFLCNAYCKCYLITQNNYSCYQRELLASR